MLVYNINKYQSLQLFIVSRLTCSYRDASNVKWDIKVTFY
jgi:hypothetical protein